MKFLFSLTITKAFLTALTITCGWTPSSIKGLNCFRNSPANNVTDVVPSPTYKKMIITFFLISDKTKKRRKRAKGSTENGDKKY